jgi:hypothetical protein
MSLKGLTVWRLWIDSDQTVKAFKILKILHRKRQSVAVRLVEPLSTFD